MTPREQVQQWADDHQHMLILLEPPEHFDAALIGVIYGFNQAPAVLYDEQKVLEGMVESGMTADDAREFFDYNTIGAFVGEATPRFLLMRIT